MIHVEASMWSHACFLKVCLHTVLGVLITGVLAMNLDVALGVLAMNLDVTSD
jgi:hypothetical protein